MKVFESVRSAGMLIPFCLSLSIVGCDSDDGEPSVGVESNPPGEGLPDTQNGVQSNLPTSMNDDDPVEVESAGSDATPDEGAPATPSDGEPQAPIPTDDGEPVAVEVVVPDPAPLDGSSRSIREFATQERFASVVGAVTTVGFDDRVAATVLAEDEYPGVRIEARRIEVVDPRDPAPRLLLGGENVNSAPHGISASLFYGGGDVVLFDDLDDDFRFTFAEPVHAFGIWIGNLGDASVDSDEATTVSLFDASGNLVASETLTVDGVEVIGSGADNRAFYGAAFVRPVASAEVSNPAGDRDGIFLDDLQFRTSPIDAAALCGDGCADEIGLDGFVGTWSGPVDQPTSSTDYGARMIVRLRPEGTLEGNIEYPELSCGATLGDMRQDGDEVIFRESLVTGFGACVDNGTIRLRVVSADVLDWRYRSPGTGEIAARATLERQR